MQQEIRLSWEDPTTGDQHEIAGNLPITIGRGTENTVTLHSTVVSREHARLEEENGAVVLRDLGSTNGVQVNGLRVGHARLSDGEIFQIGPFTFTVLLETLPEIAPAPEEIIIHWRKDDEISVKFQKAPLPVTIGRSSDNTLVLSGTKVSRLHATIVWENGELALVDNDSTNGTFLNGTLTTRAVIPVKNEIQIGEFIITILLPEPDFKQDDDKTLEDFAPPAQEVGRTAIFPTDISSTPPEPALSETPQPERREATVTFPPPVFNRYQIIPIAELKKLKYPLEETPYLTIGGGIGSFVWADHLVICGVKPEDIVAIGVEPKPYSRLQRFALNSQIPSGERLRSNSDACPDNIWGWPGYAVRELWHELGHGNLSKVVQIGWQLFSEPDLAETYTPRSSDVFASIDREAARIGWEKISRFGRVRAVRKTDDQRYVVAYSQTRPGQGRAHKFILTPYLHIAVGYPAVRFLPDLQQFREQTNDFKSVVNAYEDHNHVYEHLRLHGGTVVVRGRGIVASRVIYRLNETRKVNADIQVIHLLQAPIFKGSKYGRASRLTKHHWEYQPFNWPKACWGGDLRFMLERVTEDERDQLLNDWGGSTTSDRRDWMKMVEEGIQEGWYKIRFGYVERVQRDEGSGKLDTVIRGKTALEGSLKLLADFVIDATGFVANLESNPLLKDLADHYHLPRNVKDRLKVSTDFEITEMRNGSGRVFATGAATLGSAFAPVDSFLGLQYAAFRSVDHLTQIRAPGLKSLSGLRSVAQWLRWARGMTP